MQHYHKHKSIICAILVAAFLYMALLLNISNRDQQIAELKTEIQTKDETISALQEIVSSLADENSTIKKESAEKDKRYDDLEQRMNALEVALTAYDVPLDDDLIVHTVLSCKRQNIEPELIFSVMEKESQFDPEAVNYNSNGTTDIGLMQINSVHWDRLSEVGLDVHTPEDNIDAAVSMLAELLEKYPEEKALAAYNAGEAGMRNGGGREYSKSIQAML